MSKAGVGTLVAEAHEMGANTLDMFSGPILDTSLIHGKTLTIYPSSVLTDTGPYDFIIPSDGVDFTDLPFTRLEGAIEIVKSDGTKLTDSDLNAYVNLLPHSLFKQVEVSINGQQVSDLSTPTYAYKCFIETLLSYPEDVKSTSLMLEHFNKDTLGEESVYKKSCISFAKRHKAAAAGKIYFSIILHSDLFHSEKYLLPGCEIRLKFIRNADSFSLLGDTLLSKIKIHDLRLQIRRVTVDPSILDQIESGLSSKPALFPITSSKIRTYTIHKDMKMDRVANVFRGILPRSIIVGFVKTKAFDGAIDGNPFIFEHFDLNQFQLYINGEPHFSQPLQPDFTTGNYFREYRWFLDNVGLGHGFNSIGLSMDEFKTNSFFIPIDLTPNLCNGVDLTIPQEGFVDIMLGFKTSLTENVTMIVYASFNEVLTIDKVRNITVV